MVHIIWSFKFLPANMYFSSRPTNLVTWCRSFRLARPRIRTRILTRSKLVILDFQNRLILQHLARPSITHSILSSKCGQGVSRKSLKLYKIKWKSRKTYFLIPLNAVRTLKTSSFHRFFTRNNNFISHWNQSSEKSASTNQRSWNFYQNGVSNLKCAIDI